MVRYVKIVGLFFIKDTREIIMIMDTDWPLSIRNILINKRHNTEYSTFVFKTFLKLFVSLLLWHNDNCLINLTSVSIKFQIHNPCPFSLESWYFQFCKNFFIYRYIIVGFK